MTIKVGINGFGRIGRIVFRAAQERLGIEEGIELNPPLFDLFLKNDAMHDPMVNESYCETFGWVSKENLARMQELTFKANDVLKKLFDDAGLILVDFKLEFGLYKGEVVLGDEFSPDGSRLWDKETLDKMDKDRFRQSLGGLIEAYEAVCRAVYLYRRTFRHAVCGHPTAGRCALSPRAAYRFTGHCAAAGRADCRGRKGDRR
jgi:phosphoribosylaminoimidazole-succinocarboxamide synthase